MIKDDYCIERHPTTRELCQRKHGHAGEPHIDSFGATWKYVTPDLVEFGHPAPVHPSQGMSAKNPLEGIKPAETAPVSPSQGIKKDTGKPALDLIDPHFIEEVGRVLAFGATKYEPDNWRRGMALGKVLAGVLRHTYAMLRGEYVDSETGLSHAAHATCGLMFAFHYVRTGQLSVPDDRWLKRAS